MGRKSVVDVVRDATCHLSPGHGGASLLNDRLLRAAQNSL